MYGSKYSFPPMVHEDDGTDSPLEHQRTISKLTVELGVLYYHKRSITLEPLPETPLGEGPGHQVPDVLLFDNEAELTRIIIEVTQPRTTKRDGQKIIHLIEDDDYGILGGASTIIKPASGFVTAKVMVVPPLTRRCRSYWVLI